jgi:alkylation response protein AidB-like acyl-CoA dehydrogenase
MEPTFGPDETLLRDTVRRYVDREYGFEARRARMAEPDGFSRATWAQMAELGLLAAALPADAGGFGAGGIGTLIVAEAFGGALVVEPYLASVVLGAAALELAGSDAQRARLADVGTGEYLLAFAHDEPRMRYDLAVLATRADAGGDGLVVRGEKSVVLHAGAADALIVSARTGEGYTLVLVPRDAAGVSLRHYVTPDGFPAADVTFDGVQVPRDHVLGTVGQAAPVLEAILDRGAAALCAEAVGAMDALLKRTIAYLGTRQQFGLPLARFQALQHRIADVAIEVEQARSMALLAALARDADPAIRRRDVSAAKARVGMAATVVGEQAVQLHGGIGMTDALDVSHYFKRLTMIARSFGDADHHVERWLAAAGR